MTFIFVYWTQIDLHSFDRRVYQIENLSRLIKPFQIQINWSIDGAKVNELNF